MRKGSLLGGRYRLKRRLGSGGMAAVWVADDERLDRPVAVKILSDVLASEDDYVERFDREARTAASLNHPNLVGIYDSGSEDGRPYLVMDRVDGPALSELLASGKGGGVDHERLAHELLDALTHIHDAGIVHRDIKPGNVLIERDGRARLTDFGIAQPRDASKLTKTGLVIGTPDYMAPEVVEGKPASARSDLYSLGVLLAEVSGDSPPASMKPLIDRLTEKEPRHRPRTAAAAAKLIGAGAPAGPEATTRPLPRTDATVNLPETARRAGAAVARNPRRGLLALLLLALVVGGIALASAGGGGEPSKQEPTITKPAETEPATTPAPAPEPKPVADEGPKPGKGPPSGKGKGKGKGPKK
jgi:eukaryotic-like serine/threonine-protein kinase